MALWKSFRRKKNKSEEVVESDDRIDPTDETDAVATQAAPVSKTASDIANNDTADNDSVDVEHSEPPALSAAIDEIKSPPEPPVEEKPKKKGVFSRFKTAVKKTVAVLNTDIRDLVGTEGRLVDDEFLEELFAHLVKTDMGAGPASKIRDGVGQEHRGRKVSMEQLVESAKTTILEIMAQESADVAMATSGPTVIMVVGVNGSGKTTSIAKLAHRFNAQGKKVVLGAGDTFRAAAVEQLTIWAERLGADIVTGGKDPASVAYKAVDFAKQNNCDICIVDTAGRLQTQRNLMDELTKIRNVIGKVIPEAPHEVLLVLDATAGQNALSQAKGFSEAAGCTGIVLAKLDGTAKGGVAIPIREEFQLPVKFIGLGETPDAMEKFDVGLYVDALFDINS